MGFLQVGLDSGVGADQGSSPLPLSPQHSPMLTPTVQFENILDGHRYTFLS
jgi:hypothetical protein